MKVSEQFKSTIKAYLDNMAAVDSLFAPVYQKPTKNIDNCITQSRIQIVLIINWYNTQLCKTTLDNIFIYQDFSTIF